MGLACPNKNNTLFKQVSAVYGEDAAYGVYYRINEPAFEDWYDGVNDKEGNPQLTNDFTFVNADGDVLDLKPLLSNKNQKQQKLIEVFTKGDAAITLNEDTHKYTENGVTYGRSVTDIAKAKSKAINADKPITPEQQVEFEKAVADGTKIHNYIQNIVNHVFKGTDKLKLDNDIDKAIYGKVDDYFTTFAKDAKARGSVLLSEVKVSDPSRDLAGTIDLLEIDKDGRISIYDFKTLEFRLYKTAEGETKVADIHPLKIKEFDRQITEYKKILKRKGLSNKDFAKLRVIPIRRNYKSVKDKVTKEWIKTHMSSIEIGVKTVVDGKELVRDYLQMIPVADEQAEDEKTAKLVERLRNEVKELDKQAKKESDKIKQQAIYSRQEAVNESIRKVLIARDYAGLIENAEQEIGILSAKIDTLTSGEIADAIRISDFYKDIQEYLPYIDELQKLEEGNLLVQNLSHLKLIASELNTKLEGKAKKYLNELEIRKRVQANDLFSPQKETGFVAKLFRSISQINHPLFQLFYQMVSKQKEQVNKDSDELRTKIQEKIDKVKAWGTANNVADFDLFKKMIKVLVHKDGTSTSTLITENSQAFYDARKLGKPIAGISINKERFNKLVDEYRDRINATNYFTDAAKNTAKREELIQNYIKRNSNSATANMSVLDFDDSRWTSDEWKELTRAGNEPLKEFYDFFRDTIKEFREVLPHNISTTFIPNVHKSLIEQGLKLGDITLNGLQSSLLETIQVKEQDSLYGSIDPNTGEHDFRIPLMYIKELAPDEKSNDLGVNLMLFAQSALNYKYMSEIEEDALLLKNELYNQKEIITSKFGNTLLDEQGKPIIEYKADSNTREQFRDFLNYYIYGIKMTTGDTTFDYKGKQISATKSVKSLMSYFSTKSLSLNTVSGLVNTIGGMSNAYMQGARGKYYSSSQMSKAVFLRASNDKKAMALVKKFDARLDRKDHKRANDLSVSGLNKTLTRDKFYFLQEIGDNAVQDGVLIAMLQNYGRDKEGKIRPIKETNGKSIYEESSEEGEITLSEDEKELFNRQVKAVVKNVLGNTSDDDISTIRTTLLGQVIMMFRNWIPRTVDERFGELRYNQDLDSYELGRYRYFFGNLIGGHAIDVLKNTIGQILFISNADKFSNILEQNYFDARDKAEKRGEEFNISLDEYVELEKQNIRATVRELQTILAVLAMFLVLSSGDDKDKGKARKYLISVLNRLYSELFFYLNPVEFVKIVKSPVPIVGVFTETITLFKQLVKEPFTDDKENQPGVRALKLLPAVNGILKVQEIVDKGNKEYLQK